MKTFCLARRTRHLFLFLATTTLILVTGCASTIAMYDAKAYENATSLKVETLALMDKSADPYEQHATEVTDLRMKLQKAEEYAHGVEKNSVAVSMWGTISNDGGILDRFFKEWQIKPITPPTYLNDKKEQVVKAFDKLIQLEGRKQKGEK
jgi:hypothetical protein